MIYYDPMPQNNAFRHKVNRHLCVQLQDDKIFYISNPSDSLMSLQDGQTKNLNFLKKYQLVIADCSNEHWGDNGGVINKIYQELSELDIKFIILSHCPDHHDPDRGILFYPYWYYYSMNSLKVLPITDKKQFVLGCLNGNPRPHRVANYYMLKNKKYWNRCCTSFFISDSYTRNDDIELEPKEMDFWNSIKPQLQNNNGITSGVENNLPAITNSYINLVTETTVLNDIFLTEKTWKPVASGQIFLVFGNPGTMSFLQSQGVDIFPDLIDHNYYDQEINWRVRLNKLHEVLDDLLDKDLETIYRDTHKRRVQNQEKFFLGRFDCKYHDTLVEKIKQRA